MTNGPPHEAPPLIPQLAAREAEIEAAFLILGLAFNDIQNRQLAEAEGYADFGSYCLERWNCHTSLTQTWTSKATVDLLLWPPRYVRERNL